LKLHRHSSDKSRLPQLLSGVAAFFAAEILLLLYLFSTWAGTTGPGPGAAAWRHSLHALLTDSGGVGVGLVWILLLVHLLLAVFALVQALAGGPTAPPWSARAGWFLVAFVAAAIQTALFFLQSRLSTL
jgi:hypothetical protein